MFPSCFNNCWGYDLSIIYDFSQTKFISLSINVR